MMINIKYNYMIKDTNHFVTLNNIHIALSCLLSIFIWSIPLASHSFDKKEIRFLDMITAYGDNLSLEYPIDVYASKTGDIYLLDAGLKKILIFNTDLMPVSMIEESNGLKNPISMAVDNKGMVYWIF